MSTGCSSRPVTSPALAAALRRLADDPDLCARLGDAAVTTAERYTAAAIAPQLRAVYDAVLAAR